MKAYWSTCLWLILPPMLWNVNFFNRLPETFSGELYHQGVPPFLAWGELVARILVFVFPAIMVFSLSGRWQKVGLVVYLVGLILYFLSWWLQMADPTSTWSLSLVGYSAPAWTPTIWLLGILLIGERSFLRIKGHRWIYLGIIILFILLHTSHSFLAYRNFQPPLLPEM